MSVVLGDDRTIINEADSASSPDTWTGSVSISTGTTDPVPVESTNWLGMKVGVATGDAYVAKSSADLTNMLVYLWAFPRTVVDTKANGGLQIQLGDGTNRIGFHVAGVDEAAFRHDVGPTAWQCLVLDTAKLSSYAQTVYAGSFASLSLTAITQVGVAFKCTVGAQGNVPNCYWDILRRGAVGIGVTFTGGTSGDPATFEQMSVEDRNTGNQRAHGIIRRAGGLPGSFGVQGWLKFGSTGTASTYVKDTNVVLTFESRGLDTDKCGITVQGNATGSTDFRLGTKVGSGATATGKDGCSIIAPSGVGAKWDSSGSNITNMLIYGTRFSGFTQGVLFASGQEFIGGVIDGSGAITAAGATLVQTAINGSTVAADASALVWNVNTDPDGYLDGTSYVKGTNAHHAIQFGTSAPLTMTLRRVVTSGFNASDGQNDSTLYFADRGSDVTWTVNVIGGSGNFSYKKARSGDAVNIVIDPVTTTVTVKALATGAVIQSARVLLKAKDDTGPLPFEELVTITRSGGTATVAHTGHGLVTGDYAVIKGADQKEYNGVFEVTVTGVDAYTYAVSGTPDTPATGTIKSTGAVIHGLTNASGQVSRSRTYTSNQPVKGIARKTTSSPVYKTGSIDEAISSTAGLTVTVQLVLDE